MSRKFGIVVWGLCVVLLNVLMFCIAQKYTETFWISYSFIMISFIIILIYQSILWKKSKDAENQFLNMPSMTLLYFYMIAQFPIGIIFAILEKTIPFNITIIVNTTILIIANLLIIGGNAGKEHIKKVNQRQKNHHTEL